jgi:hypothetical protein
VRAANAELQAALADHLAAAPEQAPAPKADREAGR